MSEDHDIVSKLYLSNKPQRWGWKVNGHALWEKLKFSESQKWHFGVMGYLGSLFISLYYTLE